MIERQSPRNQTLYADLLQEVAAATMPSGTAFAFVQKTIKGRTYWYLSVALGRRRIQSYVGPDSDELRQKIHAIKKQWAEAKPINDSRAELVRHLARSGGTTTPPTVAKILEVLAEGGIFHAGAVVVGSIAFQAYANMLGVKWPSGQILTQDVDVAGDRLHLAVSPAPTAIPQLLDESGMGFLPIPQLDRLAPSTGFKLGSQQLHLDVLTPMKGKASSKPVFIESLGAHAEPVRFLDYLLDDPQQAVLLARSGILINVPDPARFALHKLVVAQRRPAGWRAKSNKDTRQATLLIEVLLEDMPGALKEAFDASSAFHPKHHQQLIAGAAKLPKDLAEGLANL